ncbi:LOW QUALITY PROTEIN: hypothetical protein TorRG33x02_136220 [Trema orientale]|uniref:Uncharacterized protein n=1 Tax=Trema orientale TaxID=63057 RepID=A0A2P5EYG1_TREOI|nr:LOW QUALITY PROTEIN: hypothetical protein TorRG33x02_136220 [Trema orientale]
MMNLIVKWYHPTVNPLCNLKYRLNLTLKWHYLPNCDSSVSLVQAACILRTYYKFPRRKSNMDRNMYIKVSSLAIVESNIIEIYLRKGTQDDSICSV